MVSRYSQPEWHKVLLGNKCSKTVYNSTSILCIQEAILRGIEVCEVGRCDQKSDFFKTQQSQLPRVVSDFVVFGQFHQ